MSTPFFTGRHQHAGAGPPEKSGAPDEEAPQQNLTNGRDYRIIGNARERSCHERAW